MKPLFIIIFLKIAFTPGSLSNKPKITREPLDTFNKEGILIELSCSATGDPKPTITWYNAKTGRPAVDHSSNPSRLEVHINQLLGRLAIPEPRHNQKYSFYCNASNADGWTVSRTAHAGYAYLLDEFRQTPMAKTARIGDTALLECEPPDGMPKPTVVWKKNGVILDLSNSEKFQVTHKGSLRIKNVHRSDTGEYICTALNSGGIRESLSARLAVREKPQFEEISQDKRVKVGQTVKFKCKLKGDHPVVWTRPNRQSIPNSRISISGISFTIRDVQLSDAGLYICKSSSAAGPVEAVVRLIVESPPTFSQTPEDQHVIEGSDVTFHCVSTGFPPPKMYWELPAVSALFPEEDKYPRFQVHMDGRLVIMQVQVTDAGKYLCNAHSSVDAIHASATLTVEPRQIVIPPIITLGPDDQVLRVGSAATLRCEVTGSPSPHIYWIFGPKNQKIDFSDHRFVMLRGRTLQIIDLKESDSDNYTCIAVSGGLQTNWTAQLKVLRKNSNEPLVKLKTEVNAPFNIEMVEKSHNWIIIKWDVEVNNRRQSVQSYRIEMAQVRTFQHWIVINDHWKYKRIQINGLASNTEYIFVVRARSVFGLSRASPPSDIVRTRLRPAHNRTKISELPKQIHDTEITGLRLTTLSYSKIKVEWEVSSKSSLSAVGRYHVKYWEVPLSRCTSEFPASNSRILTHYDHCSFKDYTDPSLQTFITHIVKFKSKYNHEEDKKQFIEVKRDVENNLSEVSISETTVLSNLMAFRCYAVKVIPYSVRSILGSIQGKESRETTAFTYEDIPTKSPQNINARWLTNSSVEITWSPPEWQYWNGLLKGYIIYMFGNQSKYHRTVEVNVTTHHTILTNVVPEIGYMIHMAAVNCKGLGTRSVAVTLPALYPLVGNQRGLVNQPWFIGIMVVSLIIWILLCVLIIYMFCHRFRRSNNEHKKGEKAFNLEPLIKRDHVNTEGSSCTSQITGNQPPDLTTMLHSSTCSNGYVAYNNSLTTGHNQINSLDSTSDISPIKSYASAGACLPLVAPVANPLTTTSSVAPYATTSLIQTIMGIGQYGPSSDTVGDCNAGDSHYYSDGGGGGDDGLCSECDESSGWLPPYMLACSPMFQMHTSMGRQVLNIGEIIPPPPEYPPPPAPLSLRDQLSATSKRHLQRENEQNSSEASVLGQSRSQPKCLAPVEGHNCIEETGDSCDPVSTRFATTGPSPTIASASSISVTGEPNSNSHAKIGCNKVPIEDENKLRGITGVGKQAGPNEACGGWSSDVYTVSEMDMRDVDAIQEDESEDISCESSCGEIDQTEIDTTYAPNLPQTLSQTIWWQQPTDDTSQPLQGHYQHKQRRHHKVRPASPGYSTDSTYSCQSPPTHRPYPKSERRKQMKVSGTGNRQTSRRYDQRPHQPHVEFESASKPLATLDTDSPVV